MALPEPQILLVTGKGGVGKTAIATALAHRFAQRGLKTLLVETEGASVVSGWMGETPAGYEPKRTALGFSTMTVTPEEAIRDFVLSRIKVRRLYKLVFENRIMGPILQGLPGLYKLVQLGKVYELAEKMEGGRRLWDRIVVDAPATGHGLGMLDAPRAMAELTAKGAFHENARLVHDVIEDAQRTGIVLVSLPEEMPVHETIDLYERLGPSRTRVRGVLLNQVEQAPFGPEVDWATARRVLSDPQEPARAEATRWVERWLRRSRRQEGQRAALEKAIPVPVISVGLLQSRAIGPKEIAELSAMVGHRWLGDASP